MPKLINWNLIGEPLNWAVVFLIATVWLFAFHTIMVGFSNMSGQDDAIGGSGPGTVAAPVPATDLFQSMVGGLGSVPAPLQTFPQGNNLSDAFDGRYAEDNYGINY
jgi:hypothetical protein